MSDIDNVIANIKARKDALQLAKARAQATRETAQATEQAAMKRLQDEFGVDNLSDARARLTELQNDLQTQLAEITEILDNIDL